MNEFQGQGRSRVNRGFALPSAIFLIVVLAALAAFLGNIAVKQHVGSASDVQGSRAYQAARAGIEWGLYNFLVNGNCSGAPNNVIPGGTLAAFTVTVTCSPSGVVTESGQNLSLARIVATACNQPGGAGASCGNAAPGAGYIERELSVVAGNPPPN